MKGYSVNVTGTCDKPAQEDAPVLNLITDTQVEVVSTPDNSFHKQALKNVQEIVTDGIEKAHVDGAFNSALNQEYCEKEGIDPVLTGLQGPEPRYEISPDLQDENNLTVTDNKTGETIQTHRVKTRKQEAGNKWKIRTENGTWRYFGENDLKAAALRQKLKEIPPEEAIVRNNVKASIFQLGYHYPNDKSRYRSLVKHKLWAYSRSFWINCVRIVNYTMQTCQRSLFGLKSLRYMADLVTTQVAKQVAKFFWRLTLFPCVWVEKWSFDFFIQISRV